MTLGLYEARARRRNKRRWTFLKWLLGFALIGVAGAYAYQTGSELASRQVATLEEEIEAQKAEILGLEAARDEAVVARTAAEQEVAAWQERYEAEVPTGEMREIVNLALKKRQDGVDLERLRFVIDAVENDRNCRGETETKRFIVPTKSYNGGNDWVGFDDTRVTVTGIGQAALDSSGNPERYIDPSKPVSITFKHIGGETEQVEGKLPIQHSLVIGDTEYRFNVVEGSRAFVNVTAEMCDYP